MMRFIENPNLPDGNVSKIICGEIPSEAKHILTKKGIDILKVAPNRMIDPAVSSHADMCALHLGGNRIIVDRNQGELIYQLKTEGFDVRETDEDVAGEYPCDVKLNVALFGKTAVGAFKYSDSVVMNNIADYVKYNVKQGYAKCSILPINNSALITDDVSVYKTLKFAYDILLVDKGDIVLDGHEYGFIGGSAAKISQNEIFFFGDIRNHRNADEILAFMSKHCCSAIYPKNIPLCDVGGIVSLFEYI